MGKIKNILIEAENTGEDPEVLLLKKALGNTFSFTEKIRIVCETLHMEPTGSNVDKILLKGYQCLK